MEGFGTMVWELMKCIAWLRCSVCSLWWCEAITISPVWSGACTWKETGRGAWWDVKWDCWNWWRCAWSTAEGPMRAIIAATAFEWWARSWEWVSVYDRTFECICAGVVWTGRLWWTGLLLGPPECKWSFLTPFTVNVGGSFEKDESTW